MHENNCIEHVSSHLKVVEYLFVIVCVPYCSLLCALVHYYFSIQVILYTGSGYTLITLCLFHSQMFTDVQCFIATDTLIFLN